MGYSFNSLGDRVWFIGKDEAGRDQYTTTNMDALAALEKKIDAMTENQALLGIQMRNLEVALQKPVRAKTP